MGQHATMLQDEEGLRAASRGSGAALICAGMAPGQGLYLDLAVDPRKLPAALLQHGLQEHWAASGPR